MDEIQEAPATDVPDAEEKKGSRTGRTIGIVLAVVLVVAIVVASIYGLVSYPSITARLRDVSIIVLALVTIIIGLSLVVLMFQLQSLIVLLRDEIKPILDSANETASTVRGTTTFVSDAVVTPLIEAAGYAAAVRQTFKTLFGDGRKKRKQGGQRRDLP